MPRRRCRAGGCEPGRTRLLPWQSSHSEFYFTDVYWPAFREIDLLRAIRTFRARERRFGR